MKREMKEETIEKVVEEKIEKLEEEVWKWMMWKEELEEGG